MDRPLDTILNSREEIARIDQQNVLGSVEALPKQCRHAWEQTKSIDVPDECRRVDSVVMCGMGGSGLGARVIESVYGKQLKIPLVRVNTYDLPGFVNEKTLVICSSYSGTTEETLSNAEQAIVKKAKWMAIGTGEKLIEMTKTAGVPYYQIVPTHNPSNQPRMAIGYSVVGQLALAHHAGIIDIADREIDEIVAAMESIIEKSRVEIEIERNQAKQLAQKMKGKVIVYVSAEHLIGAMHTVSNQQNENAKAICMDVTIPELNHHLMEGLKHPDTNGQYLLFVFANSSLYSDRIQKRFSITQQVVEKNSIETASITLTASTPLAQSFELIQIGAYANLYLSILYGQNPAPIPWVDFFKRELSKT